MRGAGSLVLGLALLVQGCAGLIPGREREPEPVVRPPAPVPGPGPARGTFTVARGRPGLVIAAPHGGSDTATEVIGADLARLTGWGAVLAQGFSTLGASGRRLNVNRPTESAPGDAPRLEIRTPAAREAFDAYRAHVAQAAQGPLRLYVEVHGNGRQESAERIEIATVGLTPDEAWRVRTLLELVRDARLGGIEGPPRLAVLIEPLDALYYAASAAKEHGVLGTARRALHIELPRAARITHREAYTALLADFLTQSARLLLLSDGQ
jgi:hypothetical protein